MTSGSSGTAEGSVHSHLWHMRLGTMLRGRDSTDVFGVWPPSEMTRPSTLRCTELEKRLCSCAAHTSECRQVICSKS